MSAPDEMAAVRHASVPHWATFEQSNSHPNGVTGAVRPRVPCHVPATTTATSSPTAPAGQANTVNSWPTTPAATNPGKSRPPSTPSCAAPRALRPAARYRASDRHPGRPQILRDPGRHQPCVNARHRAHGPQARRRTAHRAGWATPASRAERARATSQTAKEFPLALARHPNGVNPRHVRGHILAASRSEQA